jgi:hypothetical protein
VDRDLWIFEFLKLNGLKMSLGKFEAKENGLFRVESEDDSVKFG